VQRSKILGVLPDTRLYSAPPPLTPTPPAKQSPLSPFAAAAAAAVAALLCPAANRVAMS
jgi:hypothetical protein